jgi:hypothetical protein
LTDTEEADQPVNLEPYQETGHLVLEGTRGSIPVAVVITPYAQDRMRQRDIDETDVLQALEYPLSCHGRGQSAGRFEVAGMTDAGQIRVVYGRPHRDIVLVVTTHRESE